jgi:hypothetical protein
VELLGLGEDIQAVRLGRCSTAELAAGGQQLDAILVGAESQGEDTTGGPENGAGPDSLEQG